MPRLLTRHTVHRRVVCDTCGKDVERVMREDGTFLPCGRCGGRMAPRNLLETKRLAKARAEVARMDPLGE